MTSEFCDPPRSVRGKHMRYGTRGRWREICTRSPSEVAAISPAGPSTSCQRERTEERETRWREGGREREARERERGEREERGREREQHLSVWLLSRAMAYENCIYHSQL